MIDHPTKGQRAWREWWELLGSNFYVFLSTSYVGTVSDIRNIEGSKSDKSIASQNGICLQETEGSPLLRPLVWISCPNPGLPWHSLSIYYVFLKLDISVCSPTSQFVGVLGGGTCLVVSVAPLVAGMQ